MKNYNAVFKRRAHRPAAVFLRFNSALVALCVLALIALAAAMVTLTLSPAVTVAAHTETTAYNWYFKPCEDGGQPVLADNAPFIPQCKSVLSIGAADDMSIYLTFDVGYENGNTERILDVLKQKLAPAAFFVTGHYVKSQPELVRRMEAEGHLVCNHTMNHKDLSAIDQDGFVSEVQGLAEAYREVTGNDMPLYLRPPEGKYSERCINMAAEFGYKTVFWSFAYKDWLNDDQPDPAASTQLILRRTHPGAVALLHSNSATNAQILGDVIDGWRDAGYVLRSLDELAERV